ncbi:MAG: hypothetical protein WCV55_03245 [Candidatus Paceibacterota bacterium]
MSIETPNSIESREKDDSPKILVNFIRHSLALYDTYKKMLSSSDPLMAFDVKFQTSGDLTKEGEQLATVKAKEFLSSLNPSTDDLFFASSNETRVFETAQIYKKVATEIGFNIIKPDNTRNTFNDDEEIRILNTLSINHERGNKLVSSAFNSKNKRSEINWDAIPDKSIKDRYDKLCNLVDSNDQGNWGANWAKFSEEAKNLFPEFNIQTMETVHSKKFKDLGRLISFAAKKALKNYSGSGERRIVVLGFGHEDILMKTLTEEFNRNGLKNCEAIELPVISQ